MRTNALMVPSIDAMQDLPKGAETMKRIAALILVAAFAVSNALAEDKHHPGGLSDGEIRKVDKDAKKLTIKHGPLQNLDMPAMTMVFQVNDPGVLDQLKAGDKVKFLAEKIGGAYTVTKIESVR